MVARAFFTHDVAHARQFVRRAFGGERRFVDEHGFLRQGRAALPDFGDNIVRIMQRDVPCGKSSLHMAQFRQRKHIARNADARAVGQVLQQPLDVVAARAEFAQFDFAAGQLHRCLFPIAAVGPQCRSGFRDDQRACRTGEAGKPHAALPMLGQVFRQMRVGGGRNPRV